MMLDDWTGGTFRRLRRHWRGLRQKRQARRLRGQTHALADYYRNPARPEEAAAAGRFLVLDMETTGLQPRRHQILSLGWVLVDDGVIQLETARHLLIRPTAPLEATNATIHGITDAMAATGCSLEEGLSALLPDLNGRILVGHHVGFEQAFLNRACVQTWGAPLLVPKVDTLALGIRAYRRSNRTPPSGGLTLAALREGLDLPRYRAHHALSDALATAELLLAYQVRNGWDGRQLLAQVD